MVNEKGKIVYQDQKTDNISDFKKRKGVWALFGEKEGEYYCLNVAKTVDIGHEIETDVSWLREEKLKKGNTQYINQFGEYQFEYKFGEKLQSYLYPTIFSEYKNLTFIIVNDEENDRVCEKKFAWATHSKYWRNGRPFKKERKDYYKEKYNEVLKNTNKIKDSFSFKTIDDWIEYINKFKY